MTTAPTAMIEWLDRRILSVQTWLGDHGRRAKKPRPDDLIAIKEEDLAKFEEIKAAYVKALAKRAAA